MSRSRSDYSAEANIPRTHCVLVARRIARGDCVAIGTELVKSNRVMEVKRSKRVRTMACCTSIGRATLPHSRKTAEELQPFRRLNEKPVSHHTDGLKKPIWGIDSVNVSSRHRGVP